MADETYAKQYRRRNGLDYFLVVLVIVVLIIAFSPDPLSLFMAGGHSNARRAACMSNMKQLGLALSQYAQEEDGALPMAQSSASSTHSWRETIYPFVKTSSCYACFDDNDALHHNLPDDLPRSYVGNHLGPNATGQERGVFADAGEKPTYIRQLPDPGKTILLTDARGVSNAPWNMIDPAFLPGSGRTLYTHKPRHLFYDHPVGTLNCLFADGHVKSLKPSATLAPLNLWTRDNTPFTGQDLQTAQTILAHAEQE